MREPRGSVMRQLAQLLVGAAPRLRPQPGGAGGVGMPSNLPALLSYGPQPQGLEQHSRFTGGNVPGGGLSMVHPPEPTPFHEPHFPGMPQAPRPAPPSVAPVLTGGVASGQ